MRTSQRFSVVSYIPTLSLIVLIIGCGEVKMEFVDAAPPQMVDATTDGPTCTPRVDQPPQTERFDVVPAPIVDLGEFLLDSCNTLRDITALEFMVEKQVPGKGFFFLKNNLSVGSETADLPATSYGTSDDEEFDEFEKFKWEGRITVSAERVLITPWCTNCNDPVEVGGADFRTCLTSWSGTNSLGEPVSVSDLNICVVTRMR